MKLYELAPTRSIRVRWTLQELGVDFSTEQINLLAGDQKKPEFLRLNPAAKLPVLVDGDLVLTESVAIVLYLADKYPEAKLAPMDLKGRAELYRWLLFTATELEQPLWRISKHTNIYAPADRLPADIVIAKKEFREMAAVAEKHMRDREFVVGNKVSIADFVFAYTLDWANEVKLLDQSPTLVAYLERMYARPHAAPRIATALKQIKPN